MSTEKEYIRFMRIEEVLVVTTLKKSTLWELIREKKFPKPAELSVRTRAWKESEVQNWMKAKLEARDDD